jgi:hypothetical protein
MRTSWRLGSLIVLGFVVFISVLSVLAPKVIPNVWRMSVGHRPGITLANFNRIEFGMTHSEVARILGSWGGEGSRVSFDGPPAIDYMWLNISALPCSLPTPCVGQIVVSFSGKRVVGKWQSGLVNAASRSNLPLQPAIGADRSG